MENRKASVFTEMDFTHSKPISAPMETIHVVISCDLFGQYGVAFVNEAYRVNPLLAERVGITADEIEAYSKYLLTQRINCVNGKCEDYRKIKLLCMPVWIQYNLSMVGKVVIRDRGLTMIPEMETSSTMTFEEALTISDKIAAFEDYLQVVFDAMPRQIEGDKDVMSTALIAGYVRSLTPVTHVASTYLTAFMGMRLKEELAMAVLYRIQYDDVAYIATALTSQRGLI